MKTVVVNFLRFAAACGILSAALGMTPAMAGEVMKERCSARVAIPPHYNGRPDSVGTVILTRPDRGWSAWSNPFRVQTSREGRIRWWCNSTRGNVFDPGTWRTEFNVGKLVACVTGAIAVVVGTEIGKEGIKQCPGALQAFNTSAWNGWTPERSRCSNRSTWIRARLGSDRQLQIQCLGR